MPTNDAAMSVPMPAPLDLAGRRLHFVGIGGCGMSGLARMCAARGAVCSGSDSSDGPTVQALREAGIDVALRQRAASVPDDAEAVVISAAIAPEHPERLEAQRRGLDIYKYAQLLGRLMIGTTGVAVAGTHGKSTTTSILCHVLIEAGLDPSFIVGANCRQIGGGWRVGEPDRVDPALLIAEACEYDRSFHHFFPTHAVILNVEADHLDLYAGIEEIIESFRVFAARVPASGSLLIQHESPHRLALTAGLDCEIETLGLSVQADWRVELEGDRVRLHHGGSLVCQWINPMPGEHFAYNAAAAAVTAHRLGAPWEAIGPAITSFAGLDRRMQSLGEFDGVTVIDDYGHHPTEIDTTLRALRRHHQPRRLICVFQPHQHSRTRHLMEQFAVSFSAADIAIVPEIYFVRDSEQERQAITAGALVDRLRKQGVTAMHLHPFAAIVEQLEMMLRPGDLVVTMGAGDVDRIGKALLAGHAAARVWATSRS